MVEAVLSVVGCTVVPTVAFTVVSEVVTVFVEAVTLCVLSGVSELLFALFPPKINATAKTTTAIAQAIKAILYFLIKLIIFPVRQGIFAGL